MIKSLVGGRKNVGNGDGSGRRQQGRRGKEAAGGSKGFGVWYGSNVGDGSGKPLFVVILDFGKAEVSGAAEARLYLWFFLGSMRRGVGIGRAVKWLAVARVSASSGTDVSGIKSVSVGYGSG